MQGHVIHIQPLASLRRERLLPHDGKILVRKSSQVQATSIISESVLHPEHLLLDVARGLGLTAGKADDQLKVKAGMDVSAGDVLAGPVGWSKRIVRAPKDGRIMLVGEGQILMQVKSIPTTLEAGIPGLVSELVEDRGAIIETTGSIVQGIWGNGKVNQGVLLIHAADPAEILEPQEVKPEWKNQVILAGVVLKKETLIACSNHDIHGLIVGGLNSLLVPLANKQNYPIIVLDGFGNVPLNLVAYTLLRSNETREVAINAEKWDHFSGMRPEVIIPLPEATDLIPLKEIDTLIPGMQVKSLRAPYTGRVGRLNQIRPGTSLLKNGLSVKAAEILFENGEVALIPVNNLEIIG